MNQIKIKTPMIKLNNLLKYASIVNSGGEAKNVILDGEVKVNGQTCTTIRKKIVPGDIVSCFGEELEVVADTDAS